VEQQPGSWKEVLRSYWLVITIYLVVALFTAAHYMADTNDYADSVLAYHGGRYRDFWEFGHLSWIPLGSFLFWAIGPLTRKLVGDDLRANVILIFMIVNWIAGLVSVVLLRSLLWRFAPRRWIVEVVTIVFIFAQGFLNFSQTACSYVSGLALVLVALYVLLKDQDPSKHALRKALLAGLALAGAVSMWFLYVLAVPAVVLSPVILFGSNRKMWRLALATGLSLSLFIATAYLLVVVGALHIYTIGSFRTWMSSASHDTDIAGFSRMVFGLARSFIYMGNDGVLFKRYLLHDPFNPVSLADLFRLSLWKLFLFYAFLGAVGVNLLVSAEKRKVLYLLLLSCAPVIVFAVFFDGGAIERYLPLYPMVFLALAVSLFGAKSLRVPRYTALAFALAVVLVNAQAMAKPVLDRRQDNTTARVAELQGRIKPHSLVMAVTWQDELVNFSRSFPFNPINRAGRLRIASLVTPGTTLVSEWRQNFATQTIRMWGLGGEMWVSKRVLSPRPQVDWNWVEGDDRRVSWTDFYNFFSQVEFGDSVGGSDGFVLLPPTVRNRQLLEAQLSKPSRTAKSEPQKRELPSAPGFVFASFAQQSATPQRLRDHFRDDANLGFYRERF
jgi:hypothetical protein